VLSSDKSLCDIIVQREHGEDAWELCKIIPSVDEEDPYEYTQRIEFSEEDHANASLIAAAPELLEVIVEFLVSGAGTPDLQQKALQAIQSACPYMFHQP